MKRAVARATWAIGSRVAIDMAASDELSDEDHETCA